MSLLEGSCNLVFVIELHKQKHRILREKLRARLLCLYVDKNSFPICISAPMHPFFLSLSRSNDVCMCVYVWKGGGCDRKERVRRERRKRERARENRLRDINFTCMRYKRLILHYSVRLIADSHIAFFCIQYGKIISRYHTKCFVKDLFHERNLRYENNSVDHQRCSVTPACRSWRSRFIALSLQVTHQRLNECLIS